MANIFESVSYILYHHTITEYTNNYRVMPFNTLSSPKATTMDQWWKGRFYSAYHLSYTRLREQSSDTPTILTTENHVEEISNIQRCYRNIKCHRVFDTYIGTITVDNFNLLIEIEGSAIREAYSSTDVPYGSTIRGPFGWVR